MAVNENFVMPDIIIQDTLNSVLQFLRDDYNDNGAARSFLYRLFKDWKLDRYGLFEQAKSLIVTTDEDPKHIRVQMAYNRDKADIPQVFVNLSGENSANNGLGFDQGFISETVFNGEYIVNYNRRFKTTYNIGCVSQNRTETILLYYLIRAMLISANNHLQLSGLSNPIIGGQDVRMSQDIAEYVFMRVIGLSFEYEQTIPDMFSVIPINSVNFSVRLQSTIDVTQ